MWQCPVARWAQYKKSTNFRQFWCWQTCQDAVTRRQNVVGSRLPRCHRNGRVQPQDLQQAERADFYTDPGTFSELQKFNMFVAHRSGHAKAVAAICVAWMSMQQCMDVDAAVHGC